MGADLPVPPADIRQRNANVQVVKQNTLEIPFDPLASDLRHWFDQGAGMRQLTDGNKVTGFISGAQAIENMVQAIKTADRFDHYIYLLNWFVDLDFPLGVAGAFNLDELLRVAQSNLVQIRAMFWDQVGRQNTKETNRLNDANVFPGAAAILDNNTLNNFPVIPSLLLGLPYFVSQFLPGSHHQKVLIVKGREGLIAFVGGVDWNEDRINSVGRQPGSPMHDVHCRIEGPAAKEVLKVFIDRWQDHPESKKLAAKNVAPLRGINEPDPPSKGVSHIQIGCTFGNGTAPPGGIENVNGGKFYTFAPQGERTAERIIHKAILNASLFIYIEDQYLVGRSTAIALKVALAGVQKLIILVPHSNISDHPHVWHLRKEFVRVLFDGTSAEDKAKVTICYRKRFGDPPVPGRKTLDNNIPESYIHAKMMIVDDKFALIGSANCGFRSYTHDSEIVAGIFDESQDEPGRSHFAHDLRIKLWAKHLALPEAQVFDPVGASVHWSNPLAKGGVDVYDPDADTDAFFSKQNIPSERQAEPYGGIPGRELNP